jgi:hypothetical protein
MTVMTGTRLRTVMTGTRLLLDVVVGEVDSFWMLLSASLQRWSRV